MQLFESAHVRVKPGQLRVRNVYTNIVLQISPCCNSNRDAMTINTTTTTSNSTETFSRHFLSLLHPLCQGHHSNLSATTPSFTPTTSFSNLSTGEGGRTGSGEELKEEEDTDFGAVMYITAVLVFYSLGIVVMIVKYLKTERKEMEEEAALENFFKGIPSKKIQHEQDAVNRVAIRAFHTLTSGVARAEDLEPPGNATTPTAGGGRGRGGEGQRGGEGEGERGEGSGGEPSLTTTPGFTLDNDESDSSSAGEQLPGPSPRERSKYLPRVSLMFRDSRSHDRRKMQDSIRSKRVRSPLEDPRLSTRQAPSRQSASAAAAASVAGPADNGCVSTTQVQKSRHGDRSRHCHTSRPRDRRVVSPAEDTKGTIRPAEWGKPVRETSARVCAGVRFEDDALELCGNVKNYEEDIHVSDLSRKLKNYAEDVSDVPGNLMKYGEGVSDVPGNLMKNEEGVSYLCGNLKNSGTRQGRANASSRYSSCGTNSGRERTVKYLTNDSNRKNHVQPIRVVTTGLKDPTKRPAFSGMDRELSVNTLTNDTNRKDHVFSVMTTDLKDTTKRPAFSSIDRKISVNDRKYPVFSVMTTDLKDATTTPAFRALKRLPGTKSDSFIPALGDDLVGEHCALTSDHDLESPGGSPRRLLVSDV